MSTRPPSGHQGRNLRIAALGMACSTLLAMGCSKETVSTNASPTTLPSASSGGGTTAAPKGTEAPSNPDGIKTADAEKVILTYFTSYYAGDTEAQDAVASGVVSLFAAVDRTTTQATGEKPSSVPAKLTADLKSLAKDGDKYRVTGTLTAIVTQASSEFSKVADHKIVISDIVLAKNAKGVLAVDDYTVAPDDGYGPLLGKLSDQIGFIANNAVAVGDVKITMGPVFRTVGLGSQSIEFALFFQNSGTVTYNVSTGALATTYNPGIGGVGAPPTNGIHVPTIAPGKSVAGVMQLNQPSAMQQGTAVPKGKLTFSLVDATTNRGTTVEIPVPAFPAVKTR